MKNKQKSTSQFSNIPSVSRILDAFADLDLSPILIADIARRELDSIRSAGVVPNWETILSHVRTATEQLLSSRLRPVINATGILLHTNLGRAPLGERITSELANTIAGYTNLEQDLYSGERGQRGSYVEHALAALCQAEAAVIVNNCAAALLLMTATLSTHPQRREIVVSRGELIQIGGGFRIPDILTAAGAYLREVGTTNNTSLDDFVRATSSNTAAWLSVHRSNFIMEGFVHTPTIKELYPASVSSGIPLIVDLGSGAVSPTDFRTTLPREPMPQEAMAKGAALVCFSGDKLFGGPQSGIVIGQSQLIERLKNNPLFRALRVDKITLSLLQQIVDIQIDSAATTPLQAMINIPLNELKSRARTILQRLPKNLMASPTTCSSRLGGGTLPSASLPSAGIALQPHGISTESVTRLLRHGVIPVVSYINQKQIVLDLRTVMPRQDNQLTMSLKQVNATISQRSLPVSNKTIDKDSLFEPGSNN